MGLALDNVQRIWRYRALPPVCWTNETATEVSGWPEDAKAFRAYFEQQGWGFADPFGFHPGAASYREPEAPHPCLHVCVYPAGWCSAHVDDYSPGDVVGAIGHLAEVVRNDVLHKRKSQAEIARLIDRRLHGTRIV